MHRRITGLGFVLGALLLFVVSASLAAREPVERESPLPRAFSPAVGKSGATGDEAPAFLREDSLRYREIRVNKGVFSSPMSSPLKQRSQRVVLNLFDDVEAVVRLDRVTTKGPTVFTWEGHIEGDVGSEVLFSFSGDAVSAVVRSPAHGEFRVSTWPGSRHYMFEPDPAKAVACGRGGEEDGAALGDTDGGGIAPESKPSRSKEDGVVVVDLLAVYSQELLDEQGSVSAIEAQVNLHEADLNKALENSQIDTVVVRVVGIESIDVEIMPEEEGLQDFAAATMALRARYGADILIGLLPGNGRGRGECPGDTSTSQIGVQAVAFSHEIGHNFCGGHAREPYYSNGFLRYSGGCLSADCSNGRLYNYGYRTPDEEYRTIMAYPPGAVVNYFSDPEVSYQGYALGALYDPYEEGLSPQDQPWWVSDYNDYATNNARKIREQAPITALQGTPLVEVEPRELRFPPEGGTLSIQVAYSGEEIGAEWMADPGALPDWITFDITSGAASVDPTTVTLSCEANPTDYTRASTIGMVVDYSDEFLTTLSVAQEGCMTPPRNVRASRGLSTTEMEVVWGGRADSYRVYRSPVDDFSTAILVADWQSETFYSDEVPRSVVETIRCLGTMIAPNVYYYWVTGDNGCGEGAPSSSTEGWIQFTLGEGVKEATLWAGPTVLMGLLICIFQLVGRRSRPWDL